jgi:DNA-binding response OmpR family regulator
LLPAGGDAKMKKPYRILVADDDPAVLRSLIRVLERESYLCVTANDAYEAAEILRTQEVDLLISDLEMPGNEGLRLIRDAPQIQNGLPIILITGFPSVDTAVQSLQLPVAAYFTKPFKFDDILREAAQAIKNYEAFRAVCASQDRTEKWSRDLDVIRERIGQVRSRDTAAWETLMDLTLQNIAGSLQDVRTFADLMAQQKAGPETAALARTAGGPMVLVNAVRETISVLEKTKGAFKSKELGDLRKRLELLLDGGAGKSVPAG